MEEQCIDQSRRTVAQFKIGHKEGVQCVQRLHNSYVLPENLSLTFAAGVMACLLGMVVSLIILIVMRNISSPF